MVTVREQLHLGGLIGAGDSEAPDGAAHLLDVVRAGVGIETLQPDLQTIAHSEIARVYRGSAVKALTFGGNSACMNSRGDLSRWSDSAEC